MSHHPAWGEVPALLVCLTLLQIGAGVLGYLVRGEVERWRGKR
jgi:hypothetical protein